MEKYKTIKIFLASSEELKEDRKWFGDFVQGINKIYQERGKGVDVFKWEFFDAANNDRRKQDEYNEKVRESNMFLALFHKKAGRYTLEEYDVAMETYRKSKQFPKIYVYCKKLGLFERETSELKAFKAGLSKDNKEYFWITYSTHDQLHLHFLQQLLMVENSLDKLKLEDGTVTLEGMHVADIDNLSFAAGNKDYQRMSAELATLPKDIENARAFLKENPDNEYMRNELQKKLNRYYALKDEFAQLQQTLFDTSQRIAAMQREQLSDKLHRATEAFESGDLDGANALLREIAIDANAHYDNMNQQRELVHQDIEAFLLQAKIVKAEVNTPIEERIEQVQAIYAKAYEWAKNSALPDEKYEGLLRDYAKFLYVYGLYNEAEPIYLRLIFLREKLYGKEHVDTATSYNDIGGLYDNQGNYAKALEYHRKALDIRKRVLGPNHPDTAVSYAWFGFNYDSQGDYAKALEYYEKASAIWERVLGPNHPYTVKSYGNIGIVYDKQGDYAKALEYYGKALDIRKRVLGPDNPDTASSYNNIGEVYREQGDYVKALEYHRKALGIMERVLGPNHPSTASSYNNIGLVYHSQGDYAKALEYYNKGLDICERVLGLEHPDTAMSFNNIGAVYYNQGYYDKALEYYGKALDIRKRVLGLDHLDTAQSYNNIGAVYHSQDNYTKALEYYGKALDIYEQVLGPDHPDTAGSYNNIGAVYDNQGDYAKALEYYEKALDIWERVLSPDHLNTAQSYNNIASVYCSQGNYAKALEYYGKVLDIRERVLGPDHLDTASSYNNIAGVYYSNGDYPNVLEYLRKTFDILERKLGSDHPNTKTVRENMEICRKLMQG